MGRRRTRGTGRHRRRGCLPAFSSSFFLFPFLFQADFAPLVKESVAPPFFFCFFFFYKCEMHEATDFLSGDLENRRICHADNHLTAGELKLGGVKSVLLPPPFFFLLQDQRTAHYHPSPYSRIGSIQIATNRTKRGFERRKKGKFLHCERNSINPLSTKRGLRNHGRFFFFFVEV